LREALVNHRIALVLALLVLVPRVARAEVKPLELGGFGLEHNLTVAGTPTRVYDMITGDLKPWWDHTFSDHPKALYIEPWPGGGFYEIFDTAGNGVKHATVIWAERGKRLRFEGPLGLTGNAVVFVCTYDLAAQGADSTQIHFTASFAGKVEKGWAEGVDGVWSHFLNERLKAFAGTPEAQRRKPWPRPKGLF
jgi:hypothetical protein